MARRNPHLDSSTAARRRLSGRRIASLLSDPKGWPEETAPLRVRARVMSNLAAQRQVETESVTLYRKSRWSRRQRLEFSLRPPLAAAAIVAMIISAAVHFMGGVEAWQPWTEGLANRFYDVASPTGNAGAIASTSPGASTNDIGRDEAEALFLDVRRFRAHMTGRLPMSEPEISEPNRTEPEVGPEPSRESEPPRAPLRRPSNRSPMSP